VHVQPIFDDEGMHASTARGRDRIVYVLSREKSLQGNKGRIMEEMYLHKREK